MKYIIYTERLESAVAAAQSLGRITIDNMPVSEGLYKKARESGYIGTSFEGCFAVIVWEQEEKEILHHILSHPDYQRIYILGDQVLLEKFTKDLLRSHANSLHKDLRFAEEKPEQNLPAAKILQGARNRKETELLLEKIAAKYL